MDPFLMQALTTLGYSMPELLGCGIALAMLWASARAGKPRRLGLAGAGLMLACALLQLALGIFQAWVITRSTGDNSASIMHYVGLISGVRLLINCVSVAGLLMLAWALCKSTQVPASS